MQAQFNTSYILEESSFQSRAAVPIAEPTSRSDDLNESLERSAAYLRAQNIEEQLRVAEEAKEAAANNSAFPDVAVRPREQGPKSKFPGNKVDEIDWDNESLEEEQVRSDPKKYKKTIAFRHPARSRRNVDKLILRGLLRAYETRERTIFQDPIWTHLPADQCVEYVRFLEGIKQVERSRTQKGLAKKYAQSLEWILQRPPFRLLLSQCIMLKKDQLLANPPECMSPSNIGVYMETLEDYLEGIASFPTLARP